MNEKAVVTNDESMATMVERVVMQGDLAQLSPQDRVSYYRQVCNSLGLNPLTQPFAYLRLNGKLTLYARKEASDQLRALKGVSITDVKQDVINDIYVVTVSASTPDGRTDTDMGAVSIKGLAGDALANAMMKALTKAKRRVTLSLVGLGWLDETEIETIPDASPVPVDMETGEIVEKPASQPAPAKQTEPVLPRPAVYWESIKNAFTKDKLPVALHDAALAYWQQNDSPIEVIRADYAKMRKEFAADPDACLDFWTNRMRQQEEASEQ